MSPSKRKAGWEVGTEGAGSGAGPPEKLTHQGFWEDGHNSNKIVSGFRNVLENQLNIHAVKFAPKKTEDQFPNDVKTKL